MSRFEQDTIKRQIQQLGEMVAAIVGRMREGRDFEGGLEAIRTAADGGFGIERSILDRLDATSAAMLLRTAENAGVYAAICAAEAEALERLGRTAEAARLKQRAAEVEGAVRPPGPPR